MDHKRTMRIEFQSTTYLATKDLEQLIFRAVTVVLEHAAMMDGHDMDDYKGNRSSVKGWASEFEDADVGITQRAESERIDGLIEDFHDKYHTTEEDEEPLQSEGRRRRRFYLDQGILR